MPNKSRSWSCKACHIPNAPFGYLGWNLFDHYLSEQGRAGPDFQRYVRQGRVSVETRVPWRRSYRHALPEGSVPLMPLDPARYLVRPFPLDSREWNDLAARTERGAAPDPP